MKLFIIVCVLMTACLSCTDLSDWTNRDILVEDEGTDSSQTDTASSTDTTPLDSTETAGSESSTDTTPPDSTEPTDSEGVVWSTCDAAFAAWKAGETTAGAPCSWSNDDDYGSCFEVPYGEMTCDADGDLLIFCDLDNPTISETVITEPGELCYWQQALLDATDTDEKVWSNCEWAYDGWLKNEVHPGAACNWETGFCEFRDYGEMQCIGGHIQISCGWGDDPDYEEVVTEPNEMCFWQEAISYDTDASTTVWMDCGAAYDAWIKNSIQPGAACDWESMWCSKEGFEGIDMYCIDGKIEVQCDSAILNSPDDGLCSWQTGLAESGDVWEDCFAAYGAWILGNAAPGEPCNFDSRFLCGGKEGVVHCEQGTLRTHCRPEIDPISPVALTATNDKCIAPQ